MKITSLFLFLWILFGCRTDNNLLNKSDMRRIIFLHHSTGYTVWLGKTNRYINKITGRSDMLKFFGDYNKKNKTSYMITHRFFPDEKPYGWKNYPYDYYNIWVKNSGENPYMGESTLEILTKEYEIVIFKHCYPVSNILENTGNPDIDSEEKRLENYMLHYNALKNKMHEFPDKKFIIWTPAVRVQSKLTEEEALRTRAFYQWMINEWDEKGDNIYIWDFYAYETEGGLYLLDKYSDGPGNSHPNTEFSARLVPLFGKFIIDVSNGKVN